MAELKAEISIMDLPAIKEKLDMFEKRIVALEGEIQELRGNHIDASGLNQTEKDKDAIDKCCVLSADAVEQGQAYPRKDAAQVVYNLLMEMSEEAFIERFRVLDYNRKSRDFEVVIALKHSIDEPLLPPNL